MVARSNATIKVLGCGGGGGNAVNRMISGGLQARARASAGGVDGGTAFKRAGGRRRRGRGAEVRRGRVTDRVGSFVCRRVLNFGPSIPTHRRW